jgi:hypothetical protein
MEKTRMTLGARRAKLPLDQREEAMLIAKTEKGQQVMKDRSVALAPRQRAAFILVDGKRTDDQVLEVTARAGVTREDLDKLLELGLITQSASGPEADAPEPAAARSGVDRTSQERYAAAYPIASQLTASLGLRGFRLNLAVEGATSYEELLAVAPRIREAVGAKRYQPLRDALHDD